MSGGIRLMPNRAELTDADWSDDGEPSKSISEWCTAEGISTATYHKLSRLGGRPRDLRVPGTRVVRVVESRRSWHARMQKRAQERTAQLEQERRREQASRAGKLAAASPAHICRRRR